MFAVIYFAIGVTVGALTKSEANGSLIVIFIWMFDVFLGAEHSSCPCAVSRPLLGLVGVYLMRGPAAPDSLLTKAQRQMVAVVVSAENRCHY